METNAKRASVTLAGLKTPLTSQEKLEAKLRLMQAMQQNLDPEDVIQHFFRHMQPLIATTGIKFCFAQERADVHAGKDAVHHCNYRLTTEDGYMGEIIFNRSKRFTEEELATIESLLSTLVFPLRNAINYQNAVRLSLRDSLTGLGNRAALDIALFRELHLAERQQQPLSLLMIDIDHFKKINDMHGHTRGDDILKAIAGIIQTVCRNSDVSFRYGGEEFVVLLNNTNGGGARIIAERIRNQIAQLNIGNSDDTVNPTVSIGIGTCAAGKREHVNDLFERADRALYRAKNEGRNRTMDIASHTA